MGTTPQGFTVEFFRNTEGRIYGFEQTGGGRVNLELLEVSEEPASRWAGGREIPFSLIFRAVENAVIAPGCPRLVDPAVEDGEMSLQRIMPPPGLPRDAVYYQAIFN